MIGLVAHLGAEQLTWPGWPHILSSWSFEPFVVIPLLVFGIAYWLGVRRVNRRYPRAPWSRGRVAYFMTALVLTFLVLVGPMDVYSDDFFWIHMIQHMMLMMVVPPLALLGAPITLALRACTAQTRRRFVLPLLHSPVMKFLAFPLVSWSLYAATMVGIHFSPLFELALQNQTIHEFEHLLFLATGLLFWWPAVGVDPTPWRMGHALRLVYLFMSMPVVTFVGLAIYSASHVLYPHYAEIHRTWGLNPLLDQQAGAAVMWLGGTVIMFLALLIVAASWARKERAAAARLDARLDVEEGWIPAGRTITDMGGYGDRYRSNSPYN